MTSMGEGLGSTLPSPSPESPIHNDDILSEILIRLPALPSSLPSASLVCTRWRRFLAHHWNWKPVGFFFRGVQRGHENLTFTHISDARGGVLPERFSVSVRRECHEEGGGDCTWELRGCRHGRVLLVDTGAHGIYGLRQVLVWNPVSGERHFVAVPPQLSGPEWNKLRVHAAVTCASSGKDPFKVALVWKGACSAHACVYSSGTGEWGEVVSAAVQSKYVLAIGFGNVLVGDCLYWITFGTKVHILEFDLVSHNLAVLDVASEVYANHCGLYLSTLAKGGGLSLIAMSGNLGARLWERTAGSDGVARWMLGGTFELSELLSLRPGADPLSHSVI